MQSGLEIALAFNTINDKKSWSARAASRPESGIDVVHFNSKTGLVSLIYDTTDNRWQVKFNKFQAQWGDYIGSIARSFYSILNTLKAAGLPFEAPPTTEGIVIEATKGPNAIVYVRWPGDTPPIDPVMPELGGLDFGNVIGVSNADVIPDGGDDVEPTNDLGDTDL